MSTTNPTPAEATATVQLVHTAAARIAVRLLAADARTTPASALTALVPEGYKRLTAQQPALMDTYWRSLAVLGIGRGDMDLARFMTFVDARVRVQLRTDRKVAG